MEGLNNIDTIWAKLMYWGADKWGCHQIPERSFFVCGYQFPVCSRCAGIILGYIVALLRVIFKKKISGKAILFTIPLIIDGSIQYLTSYRSNNIKRVTTGFLFGFGLVTSMLSFLNPKNRILRY